MKAYAWVAVAIGRAAAEYVWDRWADSRSETRVSQGGRACREQITFAE